MSPRSRLLSAIDGKQMSPQASGGSPRHFRVSEKLLAISLDAESRRVAYIPPDEIIDIIGRPKSSDIGLVDIRWKSREFCVFITDLKSHAIPLPRRAIGAGDAAY